MCERVASTARQFISGEKTYSAGVFELTINEAPSRCRRVLMMPSMTGILA